MLNLNNAPNALFAAELVQQASQPQWRSLLAEQLEDSAWASCARTA